MDKIIRNVLACKHLISEGKACFNGRITLNLSEFKDSCGFTEEVCAKLYQERKNWARMDSCEAYHLFFRNRKEEYQYKQIEFRLTAPPPVLYQLFNIGPPQPQLPLPPPVVAVAPVVGAQAVAPLGGTMIHFTGQSRLTVIPKNYKQIHLFRLPGAKSPISKFKHFNKIFPKSKAAPLVKHLGGSLSHGVYNLTKTLYQLDKVACIKSIKSCGHDTFQKLDASQTIALMDIGKISINQKNKLGSILRLHNNKKSIFATAKACYKLRNAHESAPTFGEYQYKEPYEHLPGESKTIKVPYWYLCPYDSLMATLKTSRDSYTGDGTHIGVRQGELGECIPVIIQGDYGGTIGQGEMKWIEVIMLRKGETHEKFLGSIHGKEDFQIMKETIMPHINAGVKKMNQNKILFLTWGNQFDFVPVPATLDINTIHYMRRADNNLRALWHDGHADFERIDIPDAHVARAVRVVPFSGGDLAYQFSILGRDAHAPSKCMCCDLHKRQWQNQAVCGNLFKTEDMVSDYEEWVRKYNAQTLQEIQDGPTLEEYIRKEVKAIKMYGMKGLNLLLPEVPLSQYLVPPLHILLGVGNDLLEKIDAFIADNLETAYPNIPEKAKRPTPMKDAVYSMLKKYEVEPQKYFTQTLVGGDIHRLLERHVPISAEMEIILLTPALRRPDAVQNIEVLVREFVKKIKELMQVLESTHKLLSKAEPLQNAELDEFDRLCVGFGKLWRKGFPGASITPKMHLLEVHAPKQMRQFGCLGDKTEAAIERLHQICNIDNRILAHVKNYEKRIKAQLSRKRMAQHHAVVKTKKAYQDQRTRLLSPDSQQRKAAKALAKRNGDRDKRTAALLTIDLMNE